NEAARELAERQREAGTLSELAEAEQTAAYHEARLDLARTELEARDAKERLHRLFGLSSTPGRCSIAPDLEKLPEHERPLEALESAALEKRLDLAELKAEVDAATRRIRLAEWMRFPEVRAGVSLERDTGGNTVLGPEVALELPIFNWGRAD